MFIVHVVWETPDTHDNPDLVRNDPVVNESSLKSSLKKEPLFGQNFWKMGYPLRDYPPRTTVYQILGEILSSTKAKKPISLFCKKKLVL